MSSASRPNILVIGVGPHARRTHLPALAAGQESGLVGTVTSVDVLGAADALVTYDTEAGTRTLPVTLVEPFDSTHRTLPEPVRHSLDAVARRCGIDAVVVSTEPSFHMVYTRWALEHRLSVLLDKPLSVHAGCSVDPARAWAILTDFDDILGSYRQARERNPQTLVSVQCQRRYHPAFWRMRELIAEIAAETNCPVTSVQSFHSDGQWRMPDELIDLSYHGFDRGYGKCAHSGYHFFDIVPWLLAAGETSGKVLDAVDVHATITRPADVLAQLSVRDHERLVPGFARRNPYTEAELLSATRLFGEVDAFISTAYKSGGRTITLGSINLAHNGFSQRGSLTPVHASLYKGNGRVRHENHIVEQGPFQAIHFHSLQTLSDGTTGEDPYAVGREGHIHVHVFRNNRFRPGWRKYDGFGFDALTTTSESEVEAPTQESSRRRAIREFLEYLNGRRTREQMTSEFTSHRRGATLMAGAYLSMAQQWNGGSPVAALDFRTSREPAPATLGDR
ncbi:Gfo/Idh/MocA family oxidoreductase [Sphaerisporangium sp. NPDC051017]|uniref:Gfo/Idh/MocA family oxidoreductase n=1 Tax=Sphaerisporangium sp. NPDC051017 TaxID=3154636 RepID=UPI0034407E9A